MYFEKWENRMYERSIGDGYDPDEDCPCGCEGDIDECDYDPEEEADLIRGEHLLDRYEDPNDPFNG